MAVAVLTLDTRTVDTLESAIFFLWSLTTQDYFALVPTEYSEPSLLKEQVLEPCLARGRTGSGEDSGTAPFCRHYVYPDVSSFPTGWSYYAEIPGGGGGTVRDIIAFL